jgi:O-succinylbenzoic acid--CoA ligase
MQDWLSARSNISPDKLAIVAGDVTLTYRQLDDHAAHLCAALAGAGIQRGDRLGVLLPNRPVYAALVHAAIRLGVVIVPLNIRLTQQELAWQVVRTDCRWLVVDGATTSPAPEGPTRLDIDTLLAAPVRILDDHRQGTIDLDDPFAVVFTSGTSGHPKGAVLAYGSVFYSAMASAYRIGVLPEDRWLCILPLYHVGGLSILIRSCLYGTTVDLFHRFDPAVIDHALRTTPVTLISLVPTMLHRLLAEHDAREWKALRLVLLGGAATSPELLEQCRLVGVPVATTYGLSEAASQVATALPAEAAHKPGSVGKPLMFTTVNVVDDAGHPVPPDTYGEIVVSGLTLMQGYYDEPEATARTLRDGWLHTGDIGYLDEGGDLWLVQRRSDLIVSGGENVYPAEVERVLRQHPAIKDVCVVGLPHPEWGQIVAAAVVLQAEIVISENEIVTYSRGLLAGYKQPRQIRIVEALPQTASGKIQRGKVLEMFS